MDERAARSHSGEPCSPDTQAADNLLSALDGLLVTGNRSNVHPDNYGGTQTPEHLPFDTDRDAVSLELIELAMTRNMPTLAICRGIQELNVACGGSLTAGLSNRENSWITPPLRPKTMTWCIARDMALHLLKTVGGTN